MTSDGKAYIGKATENNFWWHDEDGKEIDNTFTTQIHTVVATGNITNQLLCGAHIKLIDKNMCEYYDEDYEEYYTNNPESAMTDAYLYACFPKSVTRVFIFPSDESEKKNTVTIGVPFEECNNLILFYTGFENLIHEKRYTKASVLREKSDTYFVFYKDTQGTFIAPSETTLDFFHEETNCKSWEFKTGTTLQNATTVSVKHKALEAEIKAEQERVAKEAEAKAAEEQEKARAAEEQEKAKAAEEVQAKLHQLESSIAEKKAKLATLGMDALGIVQKAALNKEIKELEEQISQLKAII